ncbi:hypothetical protein SAMN04488691_10818 [Haloferax larsenii]|uniref:Uncharacterized protein n=1 Tax=Haloferax larsenii TaxID=302484 RepID=A0A1H7T018_HALLR|nr:hypothetical protein SAMN04488691_10818 [Haloferax larsenii]
MANVLSKAILPRLVDLILVSVVLLAITDYFGAIDITATDVYIFFFITPLGFLRLYVDYRCKKQPT